MTSGSLEARVAWLTDVVRHQLLRRGGVVQTSGGIDSAVTLMLADGRSQEVPVAEIEERSAPRSASDEVVHACEAMCVEPWAMGECNCHC